MVPYYCPICGKEFYPTKQWTYRVGESFYCSWKCYRKETYVPEEPKIDGRTANRKIIEQCDENWSLIKTFRNATIAANYIEGTEESIRSACRRVKPYKGYMWRYKENDMS